MFAIIQFHYIDLKPDNLHSILTLTQTNKLWNEHGC